jgi:O-antigen/teichoic acid export membrane protein
VLVWVPCSVLAVAVAALVAPSDYRLDAGLMAFSASMSGLAGAWYMIGLGRAGFIAIYEIAPRIVATIVAAVVVLGGGDVIWYPLLLLVAAIVSVAGFAIRTLGRRAFQRGRWADVRQVLRANRSSMATEVAGGAYNSMVVTLVGISAAPAQAASYVSGDKLYRIAQYSVSALGNSLQGWVVERGTPEFARRIRTSLLLHLALGLVGFVIFATLAPWLSGALFGEVVAIDRPTAIALGVATLGIALGTTLGRITLVGMGARREFLMSALLAAAVGVPAILVLSSQFGAVGGAWGLASAEIVSVLAQTAWLVRLRRRAGGFVVSGSNAPAQQHPTPPSS